MTLSIHADFDAGNIDVLTIDGGAIDLAIRTDKASDFYQWFYFRIDGAAGIPLTLRITNCAGSAFPLGWPGYQACVSDNNIDWRRTETSYANGVLTITHSPVGNPIWFAYFAPYSLERHTKLIDRISEKSGVTRSVLGSTLDGRPIDMLSMGTGPLSVWLYARQHPGETMAEWWAEGALDFLTSDDAAAIKLRNAATFYIVPNMNPDGSVRGHLRTNAVGVNLNREWATPTMEKSPEVAVVWAKMLETGVHFAIDAHGDESIPYTFCAGFEGIPSWTQRQGDLYTRYTTMLAMRSPDFQTEHGYPKASNGKANMGMSTNRLAEYFGAVTMTLEMPFKDHENNPNPVFGWSTERSCQLGRDCLLTLADMIDDL